MRGCRLGLQGRTVRSEEGKGKKCKVAMTCNADEFYASVLDYLKR